MKNHAMLVLALLISGTNARADGPHLSANQYDPDSTSNPYGRYGSPYSSDSANNPYGQGVPLTAPPAHQAAPVINGQAALDSPAPSPDFSGLSTLGAPGSGLRFQTETKAERIADQEKEIKEMEKLIKTLDAMEACPEKFQAQESIRKVINKIHQQEAAK